MSGDVGSAGTGDLTFGGRRLDADTFSSVAGGSLTNNVAFVGAATVDWSTRAVMLRLNRSTVSTSSTFQSTGNTSNTASLSAQVGAIGGGQGFSGDLGELFLYTKALSLSEVQALECYLTERYQGGPTCFVSDFSITGITGGGDVTADHTLSSGLVPTVNWSASTAAAFYDVTVYQTDGTTVQCATQRVSSSSLAYSFGSCTLTNGAIYVVKVAAVASQGGQRNASNTSYWFAVGSPPQTTNGLLSNGIIANYDAAYANGGTTSFAPGCTAGQLTWTDMAGTQNGTLNSFSSCGATSGWNGTGTAADPYRLTLDGSNDFVNLGNSSSFPDGTSARTLCGWARIEDATTNWGWIVGYGNAYAISQAMSLGRDAVTRRLNGSAYGNDVLSTNAFWSSGEWNHVCLSYDGTTATLYGNGVVLASQAMSWSLVRTFAYIGRQVNDAEYWPGSIAGVVLYNRVLTGAEVNFNCAAMRSRFQGASCN